MRNIAFIHLATLSTIMAAAKCVLFFSSSFFSCFPLPLYVHSPPSLHSHQLCTRLYRKVIDFAALAAIVPKAAKAEFNTLRATYAALQNTLVFISYGGLPSLLSFYQYILFTSTSLLNFIHVHTHTHTHTLSLSLSLSLSLLTTHTYIYTFTYTHNFFPSF